METYVYGILFNHTNWKLSTLIDYDYCDKEGVDRYPNNICHVPDGYRTDNMMKGGKMLFQDDDECKCKCMMKFSPRDNLKNKCWSKCCKFVKHGQLQSAMELLKTRSVILLTLKDGLFQIDRNDGGTDSPPPPKFSRKE